VLSRAALALLRYRAPRSSYCAIARGARLGGRGRRPGRRKTFWGKGFLVDGAFWAGMLASAALENHLFGGKRQPPFAQMDYL